MKSIVMASLMAVLSTGSAAQSMVEVEMTGQPLLYSQNGVTNGCGIRIVGVLPAGSSPANTIKSFDVSSNYWSNGRSLVKMIGQLTTVDGKPAGTSKRLPLFGGWLKAEGKTPAAPAPRARMTCYTYHC